MFYHLLKFEKDNTIKPVKDPEEFLKSPLGEILTNKDFKLLRSDPSRADLIIYLASHADGLRKNTINKYILDRYRETSDPNDPFKQPGPDTKYIPLLTICLAPSQIEDRAFGIQFLDSSIWQRWIVKRAPDFETEFPLLLDEIKRYHIGKIYTSPVTREYCEFTTRIYKNSHLHEIGNAGHTNDVVPFPFFQEGKFRQRFKANQNVYTTNLKQLRWRILLVDDKAKVKSASINDTDPVNQKLALIEGLLADVFTIETGDPNPKRNNHTITGLPAQEKPFLQIQYAPDTSTALEMLKNAHFDVILLDYLLGRESAISEARQLGITLLSEILKPENKNQIKLGPDNRLWIFSVTSFSWAFIDHIREEGLSQYNPIWTFNRGADPVNTPNAFLFYFTEFLYSQFTEFKGTSTLKSIWETALKQFRKSEKEQNSRQFTRNWANKTLNQVLNYWSKGDSLNSLIFSETQAPKPSEKKPTGETWTNTLARVFKTKSSTECPQSIHAKTLDSGDSFFAKSFILSDTYKEIREDYDSGLYGYLTHFLFMLSFSDGYEWEEMKTNLDILSAKIKETEETKDGYDILRKRIESLQELYVK
jgi:CheY-like chemotaxis protein